MHIKIERQLAGILPWNLSLEIDGMSYRTARPTVATIGQLQTLGTLGNADAFALLDRIFIDPPETGGWEMEAVIQVIAAYLAYFGEHTAKNSQAIAAHMKAVIANMSRAVDAV